MARTAQTVPAAEVDDLDSMIEDTLVTAKDPADPRLVERLTISNRERLASGTAKGYSFVVNSAAIAKLREREIRRAGDVDAVNCGVSVTLVPLTDEQADELKRPHGAIKVNFKARKRRGSDETASNGSESSSADSGE